MNTAFAQNGGDTAGETASELAKLIQLIITKIPLWIAGFIVLVVTFLIAKIARRMVENKLAERGIEEEHKELQILGGRLTYTGILILGITVGLKIAGIDLTTIIAAGAFGIGFALKDLIMNFLAGMMILISRHFTIGDFIKIGDTIGKVVEIQPRVTVLKAINGTKVIVPNAEIFRKQVISYTSNPFRRIELEVGIDFRNNIENVLKICMDVVKNTKGILVEPKPAVLVNGIGESSVKIKIKAWVKSRGGWVRIKSRLTKNLKQEFDKFGIRIPWPIRTVAYDKDLEIAEKSFEEEEEKQASTQSETTAAAQAQQPQVQQVQTQQTQVPEPQTQQPQAAQQPQAQQTPQQPPSPQVQQVAPEEVEVEKPLKPLSEQ
ncbi:mechanosensitive ion channel [Candidatus Peregrinibacteria bacterium]|nr:mechanosensitive ion channel [Candidatus Peregrinibacteria bacterium]